MPVSRHQTRAAEVWRLAARQHGVVARSQLRALGFEAGAIQRRVASGRLHRVQRGVYAVGRPELTRRGEWMAAVLRCGDGAALSHASAATLWGIAPDRRGPIDISVPRYAPRRSPGIRVRRRAALVHEMVVTHDGIPVTNVVQTLIDLSSEVSAKQLERAINEADRLDLLDPDRLRVEIEAHAGERGVLGLRDLLDRRTFRLTDSELERRFLAITRRAGLPLPRTGARLNGFKVDFWWPEIGLVVETDGLRYHRTPAEQARDRLRDQTHSAAGLRQLRFTHEQVKHEPDRVALTLKAIFERLTPNRRYDGD